MKTTRFSAPDIECGGCASSIERALGKTEGVATVTVDVETKIVTIQHDPDLASIAALQTRLDHAGFPAQPLA